MSRDREGAVVPLRSTLRQLRDMCNSQRSARRLAAIEIMQWQLDRDRGRPTGYLRLAAGLFNDRNERCRWGAASLASEFIPARPHDVWRIVLRHSHTKSQDMRDMLATALVEHLLEHHFGIFFEAIRREMRRGNQDLPAIVAGCWNFGVPVAKWRRLQRLLIESMRGRRAATVPTVFGKRSAKAAVRTCKKLSRVVDALALQAQKFGAS